MDIQNTIQTLREELNQHNYNYYVLDKPIISDYEFDVKLKQLQELENKYPEYFERKFTYATCRRKHNEKLQNYNARLSNVFSR